MGHAPGARRLRQRHEHELVTRVVGHQRRGALAIDLAHVDLLVPIVGPGRHVDARHEPILTDAVDRQRVLAAVGGRQHARQRAHLDLLDALGRLELAHGRTGERASHEVVPDLAGAGDALHILHRRVVGIADPHTGHQVRRIADHPRVTIFVGGAGLDGRRSIRQDERTVGAVRRLTRLVVRQNGRDLVHQARVFRLGAAWLVLVQYLAGGVGHLQDRNGVELAEALLVAVGRHRGADLIASVGEHRIGVRQVQQLDLAAAERYRQAIAVRLAQVVDPETVRR